MAHLIQIYSLREDREYVEAVQRATVDTEEFGLVPEPWLFGSSEWWGAISTGSIPTHTLAGRISRVFMSGHNDYAEFEIDDGAEKSCWTRITSEVPGSSLSRSEMATLYREGAEARLIYVLQRRKKPGKWRLGTHSKCVLEIWVEHAA